MAKKSKLNFVLTILALVVIISGCANQIAPGGGEIDRVPPQIIEVAPLNGAVNFSDDHFEITFDKYVDKRSVQDAIFISPTIEKGLKYDWSGKTLDVYFKDSLKKNTTYTVTIGTDVKDLNNSNKMAEAFTFAFSTGLKIDKGIINGKVYDPNPDGVMVFAYKEEQKQIDISKQKPDYVSQVGKNGKYTILGLSDGSYEVYAIRDQLRNLFYNKNEDAIGIQFKNVALKDSLNKISDVDFFLTREDTIAPNLSNVFMKNRNHLTVEFNKAIDSSKIAAKNFSLVDTTSGKKILPKYFFKGDGKPNQFYLVITDSLNEKGSWELTADSIPDLHNNYSGFEKISFLPKLDRDTVKLKPLSLQGNLPEGKVDLDDPELVLKFNDAVDLNVLKEKVKAEDLKQNIVPSTLDRIDDASFKVLLNTKLKQSTDYSLQIDFKNFRDVAGNSIDSLFKFKFTTANELDFSGASGTVSGEDTNNVVVMLQPVVRENKTYSQKLSSKNSFDFKKVVPGKYIIWGYLDRNKNDKYDFGKVKPFSYSEEFKFYRDTLNLRARWPVGDIAIPFDKN